MLKMMSGLPVDLSTPDLSHLTEEEKRIIQNVIHRQKMEEEKEKVLKSPPPLKIKMADKLGGSLLSGGHGGKGRGRGRRIVSIEEIGKQKQTPDTGAFCDVCAKTKFAEGAGHLCGYCGKRSCARCGAKMALKPGSSQAIWVCLGCRKKHQSVSKTGDWLEQKVGEESPHDPSNGKDEVTPSKEGGYISAPTLRIIAPSGSATEVGNALTSHLSNNDFDTGRYLTPPSSGLTTNHHNIQRSASGSFKKSHQQLICLATKASSTTTSPKNTPDEDRNLLTALRHRRDHDDDVIDDVDAVSSETLCPPLSTHDGGGGRYLSLTHTTRPTPPTAAGTRPPSYYYYYSSEDVGCYSQDEPPLSAPPLMSSTNQTVGIPFARNDSLSSDQSESVYGGGMTVSSSTAPGLGQRRRPPPPRARRLRPRALPATVLVGDRRGEEEDFKSTPFSSCGEEEEEKGVESESVLSYSEKEQAGSRGGSCNNFHDVPESSPDQKLLANRIYSPPTLDHEPVNTSSRDAHHVTWTPAENGDWLIGRMTLRKPDPPLLVPSPPLDGSVWGEGKAPPSQYGTSLLGLKIVGGREMGRGRIGAVVDKVKKGSVADTIARLQPGDEILDWNGARMSGLPYDDVAAIISQSRTLPRVRLTVQRPIKSIVFPEKAIHHNALSNAPLGSTDPGMTLRIQLITPEINDSAQGYLGIRVLSADLPKRSTAYVETHLLIRASGSGLVGTQFLGRTPAIANNFGSEVLWDPGVIYFVKSRDDIGPGRAQLRFTLWIRSLTKSGQNSDSPFAQCFVDLNSHLDGSADYGRRSVTLTIPLSPMNSALTADHSGHARRRSPSDTYLQQHNPLRDEHELGYKDEYHSDFGENSRLPHDSYNSSHSMALRQSYQAIGGPYYTPNYYADALDYRHYDTDAPSRARPPGTENQLIWGRNPAHRPTRWMSSGHLEESADRFQSPRDRPTKRPSERGTQDYRQASYYPINSHSDVEWHDPHRRVRDPKGSADRWPHLRAGLDLSTLPPLHHHRAMYRQLPRLPTNPTHKGQFLDPRDAQDPRRHSTTSSLAQVQKSSPHRKYSTCQFQDGADPSPIYSDSELTRHHDSNHHSKSSSQQGRGRGETAVPVSLDVMLDQSGVEGVTRGREERGAEPTPPLRKQSIGDKMAALVKFGRRSSSASQLPIEPRGSGPPNKPKAEKQEGELLKKEKGAGRPTPIDSTPGKNNLIPQGTGGIGRRERDHVTGSSGNALRKAVLLKQASRESYDGASSLPSLSSGSGSLSSASKMAAVAASRSSCSSSHSPPPSRDDSSWEAGSGHVTGSADNTAAHAPSRIYDSFIEGLGPGQVVSRQMLACSSLGDVQISLVDRSDQSSAEVGDSSATTTTRPPRLEVEVIRARGLVSKPNAKNLPAPYVKLYLLDGKKCVAKAKTTIARKTLDPLYQQQLIFHEDYHGKILQITVWGDYSRIEKKVFMGVCQIQLDQLDLSNILIGWYKLFGNTSLASTNSPAVSLNTPPLLRQNSISDSPLGHALQSAD